MKRPIKNPTRFLNLLSTAVAEGKSVSTAPLRFRHSIHPGPEACSYHCDGFHHISALTGPTTLAMLLQCTTLQHYQALRVQVPNNHIPTQNLYYNYYYPNPKYLIIGYMDPLGSPPYHLALACRGRGARLP